MRDWRVLCEDVARLDYRPHADRIDLLAAGAPCQPFSLGGKHRGDSDDRNMFPEVLRAVRELRPRAILIENVRGLLRPTFRPYFSYILRQLELPDLVTVEDEDWTSHDARLVEQIDRRVGDSGLTLRRDTPTHQRSESWSPSAAREGFHHGVPGAILVSAGGESSPRTPKTRCSTPSTWTAPTGASTKWTPYHLPCNSSAPSGRLPGGQDRLSIGGGPFVTHCGVFPSRLISGSTYSSRTMSGIPARAPIRDTRAHLWMNPPRHSRQVSMAFQAVRTCCAGRMGRSDTSRAERQPACRPFRTNIDSAGRGARDHATTRQRCTGPSSRGHGHADSRAAGVGASQSHRGRATGGCCSLVSLSSQMCLHISNDVALRAPPGHLLPPRSARVQLVPVRAVAAVTPRTWIVKSEAPDNSVPQGLECPDQQ